MTYGWAILIIAIVLVAFFSLNLFNPYTFSPKASPGSCQILRPNGPGSNLFVSEVGLCNTNEIPQYVAQFNGQSSYIQIPNVNSLQLSTLTFGGWVNYKGPATNNWNWIIAKQGADGVAVCGGALNVCFWDWGAGIEYESSYTLNRNTFYYMVAEVTNGNEIVFINGNEVLSDPMSISNQGEVGWQIGYGNSTEQFLNGSATNIQIYNTSLSQPEITALYQEGIGGAPTNIQNLVGWWPLNGNSNDYSGNGNNGVPTNVIFTSSWESGYTAP